MSAFLEPQNLILAGVILSLLVFSSFFSSSETALTAEHCSALDEYA